MISIDPLLSSIRATVASHRISEGVYTRWFHCLPEGETVRINEYGCADAANILYTLGDFPKDPSQRQAWVQALQGLQYSDTGFFEEPTHHPIHTTAHCVAALELFDALPLHPLTGLDPQPTPQGMRALLEGLDWETTPWPMSHRGAGMYAALVLTGSVDQVWQQAYFQWLWDQTDPDWGMSRAGTIDSGTAPAAHHLYGWFHYMFNLEYARRPLRYPEKLIDACLRMYREHRLGPTFGHMVGFMEIDWVFALNRATRQTPHRFEEAKDALRDFAKSYIPYLSAIDPAQHRGFDDLHMLFGAVCALAELQQALPGQILSAKPLRLVLDRRPFI